MEGTNVGGQTANGSFLGIPSSLSFFYLLMSTGADMNASLYGLEVFGAAVIAFIRAPGCTFDNLLFGN